MAAECAGEFDSQTCNLSEFCRRTGLARQRARAIRANGFKVKHLGDCPCELYDRPEGFSSVPLMCKR